MRFPCKWRETIDPFSLKFTNFKLKEILGYPYAGNDVFYARGVYNCKEIKVFIKVNRQQGADVKNEIDILNRIKLENIPIVIDNDDEMTYRVTIALSGERLNTILLDKNKFEIFDYLEKYGKKLGEIHKVKGEFNKVKDRRYFHIPPKEYFINNKIDVSIYDYLINCKPKTINYCFCHGDFHYANILWENEEISGILDFELAGIGSKEFDIAWAIILREGQNFLNNAEELNSFFKGYNSVSSCNEEYVRYYMILIYVWFYEISCEEHKKIILKEIYKIINKG